MTLPDFVILDGRRYEFDFKGYLKDFDGWSPRLLDWYAEGEKIELTDEHRTVIDYLRTYFVQYKALPVARSVVAEMAVQLGREKGTIKYLHALFPIGIQQAYKVAGLPRMQLSV